MRKVAGPQEPGLRGRQRARFSWWDDDELDAIEIESSHVTRSTLIVPWPELDQRFFDRPYYPDQPLERAA